jgi:AraC-like DNA-binding protein
MGDQSFTVRFSDERDLTAVAAKSARTFPRHSHDEFGIGVITQGAQRSWSGRGLVAAGRGDLITVNPGEVHDGAPIGGERAWSMLYLSPDRISAIVRDISEDKVATRELTAPVVKDRRAVGHFAAAYSAVSRGGDSEGRDTHLILLLGLLLGDATATSPQSTRGLSLVRERIDDDPASPHPLAELASLAGVSRFQTIRGFERATGLTPHAYVLQRRLDLARRLIRDGLALAEVAVCTGFADQSHLHRAFRTRYGLTPGAYASAANS